MNTPKIRFKGFTDDWEQRKLGDVCSRVQGNDGRMELPTLTISAGNGWMRQEDRFSGNIAGKEQKNYTLLRKGELSYNHGNSKLAKYGTVFSLQTYEEALVPRVYHSFKVKEGNCDFVEYYFATKLPDRELSKLISSGARMDGLLNIGYDEFMGIQMKFPSTLEQRKISLYFRKLDHLITLHQRKCDETKQLKKFMLQKMFPKNGEKNPEIRFEGFTDDWEQRKFKELCDMVTVGIANSATHAYSDSGVVMFRNQNIKPNFLDDTDIIHINSEFEVKYKNKRLKKNDLLVARTGYPGTACVVPEKYENSQTFTTLIARPNENVDPYFLCQYLNSDIGIKYFESTQIGGGQKNSGAGILNEMPVTLPSTIEEEKKIGDYFRILDHLITLHQRKCEKLKELKKFMLQNMFV